MLLHNKKTAIIGGGPVGLTLARLLQQAGADVTVYERDADATARIWGGTLDLHKGSGQEALKAAGLLEQYYERALPMGINIANEKGEILHIENIAPEHYHDNPEINRNALRELLLGSLTENTVIWNRKCTNITPQNEQWVLHFENAPNAIADVVVVANGGMSAVRKYVTDTETEDTAICIIHGDIPNPETNCAEFYNRCGSNRLMASHSGVMIVANPFNNGQLTYGVIFKRPETLPDAANTQDVRGFLNQMFEDWGAVYKQLFAATDFFAVLPTRKFPIEKPWKENRPLPITLIGDAAHLMPPFAGQGVNIGLVDAMILAANLTGTAFNTIDGAIADYEQQMRIYAIEAQQETDFNELAMQQPGFLFTQMFNR